MIVRHHLSLSQRLLVTLLFVSFSYWAVIAWFTVRDSVDEVYELFDAHLAQTAVALMRVTDPDDTDPTTIDIPNNSESPSLKEIFQWRDLNERLAGAKPDKAIAGGITTAAAPLVGGLDYKGSIHSLHVEYEKRLRYQVWYRGQLLVRSASAPDILMTERDGFSETRDTEGQTWRHYSLWDQHRDFRVVVAEAHDVRNQLVRSIALHLASPLALGLPVLILLLWLSINQGLNPLATLTREIERRKPENLIPLDADRAPGEVRPMVQSLNKLLERITGALESERRFTANAAHELRTPLAAIQAQLHVLQCAESDSERQRGMNQLQRGVERAIRLVGQMLTLARLDPEQALPDVQDLNLGKVAEAVCADLAPLALQRSQTLELEVEGDLPLVSGNPDLLSMLLSNLVDNAIRYTQPGGHIVVDVRRCDSGLGLLMEVSDDGPGIPVMQRERVFDRFYRIASHDQPGTGLGLPICRRIAELHHARITLAEGRDGKGVSAQVFLAGCQDTVALQPDQG